MSLLAGIGALAGGAIAGSMVSDAVAGGSSDVANAIYASGYAISSSLDDLEKTVKGTGRDITRELAKLNVDFETAFHLSTERSRAIEGMIEDVENLQTFWCDEEDNCHRLIRRAEEHIDYGKKCLETDEGVGGKGNPSRGSWQSAIKGWEKDIKHYEKEIKRAQSEYATLVKKKDFLARELEKEKKRLCNIRGELTTAKETRDELEEACRRIEEGAENETP